MSDWAAEQKSIYEDFKAEGFEVTVRTPGDNSDLEYIPELDEYVGEAQPQDSPTYALRAEYTARQIDGKLIQVNDHMLQIPAYGLPELNMSHEILVDSEAQTVIRIDAVSPGNVPLIYKVQVRS